MDRAHRGPRRRQRVNLEVQRRPLSNSSSAIRPAGEDEPELFKFGGGLLTPTRVWNGVDDSLLDESFSNLRRNLLPYGCHGASEQQGTRTTITAMSVRLAKIASIVAARAPNRTSDISTTYFSICRLISECENYSPPAATIGACRPGMPCPCASELIPAMRARAARATRDLH